MQLLVALRRLWKHPAFRRLLLVRIFSQAADGTLQVGMASYILFSPQSQPNAWAIAGVLAITLLPFTVVGPFVSPFLDRWPRRHIVVWSDAARAGLAALIGVVIFTGGTAGAWQVVLYLLLLFALSINRFMLAGLSAAMEHTIDHDEYLMASSILPAVGPLGVVLGMVLGFAGRLGLSPYMPAHRADAFVFFISAVLFVASVLTARRFTRLALGPETPHETPSARAVLAGLGEALDHLRHRSPAALGLLLVFISRLMFGLFSVVVILALRNHFNDDPEAALADLTLWGLFTGAGFVLSTPFVPVVVRWLGLRRTVTWLMAAGGLASALPALVPGMWPLFAASFVIGLTAQCLKISVDTIVQAHVLERFKGRAFVFYDMLFNIAFVLAALVAALWLPVDGLSVPGFWGQAAVWVLAAVAFSLISRRMGAQRFERGTEDVTGEVTSTRAYGATR